MGAGLPALCSIRAVCSRCAAGEQPACSRGVLAASQPLRKRTRTRGPCGAQSAVFWSWWRR